MKVILTKQSGKSIKNEQHKTTLPFQAIKSPYYRNINCYKLKKANPTWIGLVRTKDPNLSDCAARQASDPPDLSVGML